MKMQQKLLSLTTYMIMIVTQDVRMYGLTFLTMSSHSEINTREFFVKQSIILVS
jgi:hypothetical protein